MMVAVIILHRFISADGGPSYLSHQDVSGRVHPHPITYQDGRPSSGQNHYKRAFSLSTMQLSVSREPNTPVSCFRR